ncbi:MAG TPA: MraY family glycosyltransferase [Terriglobales bacterium]|jgi:UDP-GlcNAc:undecaprenyl-phosphate GlcNAc-1-phosphate transferase|nr:MraY family glycosyltransferase [Terriglobales bacterium]
MLLSLLVPGTLIFLLGIYDDVRGAQPYLKFSVQAVAGCILYGFGLQIFDLPILFGGHHALPWFVSLPLTIVWVLAITNAFNLIDGLDGLAAGAALFSTLVVFVVSMLGNTPVVTMLTLALAGTILGFLRFNFNPATIFLGDSGSLFIGFMLSALALRGAQKAPTIVAVAIPVVSFGLPILETSLSILRRLISGRPVFTADREHIHHKLLQRGFSHRQVVILLYAVSAVFAMLSLFLLWPTGSTVGLILAVLGTGIWIGVQHLGYLEFGEIRRVAQRTMETRQIFINNLAIRRGTEELKVSDSYEQICRILVAAFGSNDFDGFDLRSELLPIQHPRLDGLSTLMNDDGSVGLHWQKSGNGGLEEGHCWRLTLDLVAGNNRHFGSMTIYRIYVHRDLQLDINLLTSKFSTVLADALDRNLPVSVDAVAESSRAFAAGQFS